MTRACLLCTTARTPSNVSAMTRRCAGLVRATMWATFTRAAHATARSITTPAAMNATPGLATAISTAAAAGPPSHAKPSKMDQTPLHATSCSGVRARSGSNAQRAGRRSTATMLNRAASANTTATGAPAKKASAVAPAIAPRAK